MHHGGEQGPRATTECEGGLESGRKIAVLNYKSLPGILLAKERERAWISEPNPLFFTPVERFKLR